MQASSKALSTPGTCPDTPDIPLVRIAPARPESFELILQAGFRTELDRTMPLDEVLLGLGIPARYIQERIQTIFLNGAAVDCLDCPLHPGDRLALSAALPGLVGATLRRGGCYARLREGISHRGDPASCRQKQPFLEIRLFNLMARELAGPILARGIILEGEDLKAFLASNKALRRTVIPSGPVRLQVLPVG